MTEVTIAREKSFAAPAPAPVEPARTAPSLPSLDEAIRGACGRIAPLWPLESFVAVNPFLGLTNHPFQEAHAQMQRVAGVSLLMPRAFYREALAAGRITDLDLTRALSRSGSRLTLSAVKEAAAQEPPPVLPEASTVAEVLDGLQGTDWASAAQMEISRWCSAYFDQGQASWAMPWRGQPFYSAWRAAAQHDRTPEVLGLTGFRARVEALPEEPAQAIAMVLKELEVPTRATETYLHRALLSVSGWAAYARYQGWSTELAGGQATGLVELLAVRLAWEWALRALRFDEDARREWRAAVERMAVMGASAPAELRDTPDLVLHQAYELAFQRQLTSRLVRGGAAPAAHGRPAVQAVFCIDVRSEVYRRALETVAPETETLGFAGFFGFPIEYVPFGGQRGPAQCPVLLTPSIVVREEVAGATRAEEEHLTGLRLMRRQVGSLWSSFKASAVSCFSFVEAAGLGYAASLVRESLGRSRGAPLRAEGLAPEVANRLGPRLEPEEHEGRYTGLAAARRITSAEAVLKAMSLRWGFARLVMLCGHGGTTVNNPHAAGLDCGACGGNTGEANARFAAAILNDPRVRAGLADRGIEVPADTWFLAALHDTTTDDIRLFDVEQVPASHAADLRQLSGWLERASGLARAERAAKLGLAGASGLDEAVRRRSRDWAQVRPEWGLAGNAAFIAAPRARTRGLNLEGRSFLHSYDWKQDTTGSVLELIMTAPMVVASWINLQYFGSTVNNAAFGCGNKVLHNVVGRLGVLQGHGGDLQTGLPLQSVHDGARFVHEPLRLNVFIEAPEEAMNRVLTAHPQVRRLVDNGWVQLFALTDDGRRIRRYTGGLQWAELDAIARA